MVLLFLLVPLSCISFVLAAPLTGAGIGLHNFFNVYVGMSPSKYVYSNTLSNQPKTRVQRHQPDDELYPKPWTFESDMTLTPAQKMAINRDVLRRRLGVPLKLRKIVADARYYWPNGVVPYETGNLDLRGKKQLTYTETFEPWYFGVFGYIRGTGFYVPQRDSNPWPKMYLMNNSENQNLQWKLRPVANSFAFEFTIASNLNSAIKMWEKLTCIRFVARTASNQNQYSDYVTIQQTYDGCESNVGRIGGQQVVNVSNGCGAGSIAHELGHSFGFVHEQSRSDRDQHILIVGGNISPGNEKNFEKYSNKKVYTYNLSYDIGSIMHYSDKAFSRDGESKTIVARDTLVQSWMGQRDGPSFLDIKLANQAYQCDRHCKTNFVCQNGGFIGPNCHCICPYGVSGFTCDDVAPSTPNCGGTFLGENGTILSPNYPNEYNSNAECHWLIEGPFEFLKLTFRDFHSEYEYDVLDVRVYGPERVGQMISGNNFGDKIIYFSSNKLLLHFTSDKNTNFRGFRIDYSSIHRIDTDSH